MPDEKTRLGELKRKTAQTQQGKKQGRIGLGGVLRHTSQREDREAKAVSFAHKGDQTSVHAGRERRRREAGRGPSENTPKGERLSGHGKKGTNATSRKDEQTRIRETPISKEENE